MAAFGFMINCRLENYLADNSTGETSIRRMLRLLDSVNQDQNVFSLRLNTVSKHLWSELTVELFYQYLFRKVS